jgi:hypothetical protein
VEEGNLETVMESSTNHRTVNMLVFAVVTIIILIFAVGSLNTISARQSKLSDAENNLRTLEERITASIFLNFETNIEKAAGSEKAETIDFQSVRRTYDSLSQQVSSLKNEVAEGRYLIYSGDYVPTFFEVYTLRVLSTETLLGILLISCGILGSIMSTMRDGKGRPSKAIVLGASVGFVALLGVKGGSTLFILSTSGVDVPFNPYSTAFAGVVAGMFSEKLYFALSNLTDKAFGADNER